MNGPTAVALVGLTVAGIAQFASADQLRRRVTALERAVTATARPVPTESRRGCYAFAVDSRERTITDELPDHWLEPYPSRELQVVYVRQGSWINVLQLASLCAEGERGAR